MTTDGPAVDTPIVALGATHEANGDDADRARSAYHEAAHAAVAIALGIRVKVVSLRPGERFRAATYLAPGRRRSRWAREDQITVTLAGDLHYLVGGPLLTGYVGPTDEEEAARVSLAELERVPRPTRRLLLAGEADPEGESDADRAWWSASMLDNHDVQLIGVHLSYLSARASAIIRAHPRQIRALAQRLYRDTVVDGAEAERIVRWWLCSCHAGHPGWGDGQRGRAPAL
jgi:hypothetical protein